MLVYKRRESERKRERGERRESRERREGRKSVWKGEREGLE